MDDIDENDIAYLMKNQIDESKDLEYKRDLPGASDGEIHKFLSQVSSLANTIGGHIIYGVDAKDGIPTAPRPIQIDNPDKEILRLQEMTLYGIAPRIQEIEIHPVESGSQGYFIIIRVPSSWNSPHMVSRNKSSKFYGRTSRGKHQLDVEEIRTAFMRSETLVDRMKEFRKTRISSIENNDTPFPLIHSPRVVIHMLPVSAFRLREQIDVTTFAENKEFLTPSDRMFCNYISNFDGYLAYSMDSRGAEDFSRAYTQAFRNGCIESVSSVGFGEDPNWQIEGKDIEKWVLDSTSNCFSLYQKLGIKPPVFFLLSLVGVRNAMITASGKTGNEKLRRIGRNVLSLPEVAIDSYQVDLPDLLKNHFQSIWNASGWLRSPFTEG